MYVCLSVCLSVCMYVLLCMSVCMSVCLSVCHNVVSTLLDNQWTDFQNLNANSSSLVQNRAHHLWFLNSTSGLARKIENDLQKQVFGSQNENYLTDFQNSNGILSGLMKVINKKYRCRKSTSGLDGK